MYVLGALDSRPRPSPRGVVEPSVFGIAVRALLQATSLPHCMVSCFVMRSSSWPLPRLGALRYSMLCLFLALFPGAGVRCPLLSSWVLWRRLRPLPCSSVCGLHCTGPTNARQSQWETYILCRRSDVSWSAWAAHRQPCERFSFSARCNRKELSKTSPLLAPDAVVTGVLTLGHRTVCFVSLELGALVLPLRLLFVKNFAVILVEGRECGSRALPCEATWEQLLLGSSQPSTGSLW